MAASLTLVSGDFSPRVDLETVNAQLLAAPAERVLGWARQTFGPDELLVTTSFGAESAVMLHLVSRHLPKVPVVFIDTGYLFPETYRFAEELTKRFDLDLRVYSPQLTAARQEALHGKLWEGNAFAQARYQELNKIEPMQRALRELRPRAWLSGVRSQQTAFRAGLHPVELQDEVYKVHPILGWDYERVHRYLRKNDLPYHPLYQKGYRSIGDWHSTFPTLEGEDPRAGRNLGEHRECGLHLSRGARDNSLKSSGL
jgi:phosphoadenosine phosphosulfate reductase